MTKLTRKLLLSVITVVLTVVALGTTTFAWFTLTNVANVQQFDAEIIADSGIEIAIGDANTAEENFGLNWVTTLTTLAIENYISTEYAGNFKFNHVTTADGQTFRNLGIGAQGTTNTSSYLELPIHFKSNSAVAIAWTGVTLTSENFNWSVDQSFNAIGHDGTAYVANPVTSGDVLTLNAADAFRIAIIGQVGGATQVVGYENPATTTAPYNHVLGTGGTGYEGSLILDPDGNPGTGDEVYEGTFGSHSYFYNDSQTSPFGIEDFTTLATQTSISNERILDMVAQGEDPLVGSDYYGSVTIRIWLEGWDLNAYNSILSQIITTSFQFTGLDV